MANESGNSVELLPAQAEFLLVDDDVTMDVALYQGGYGSGKTWSGSLLGLILAQQMPGSLGLVVAKTFPMVRDTTMRQYFEHLDKLVEDGILEPGDYSWNKSEARLTFHCFDDSEIIFRHLEDPEKVKSLNLAWVQVEEASMITEADFLMLLSRLRQKYPVLRWFGHTNPQPTKGWIYKYFVENNKGKRKDGKAVINYRRIMAPSTQNKFLPAGYLENMAGAFDPEYYAINVLGQDGDYTAGLVVKNWSIANEDTSIVYNPNWPIYITCDFNVDPMCWALVHRTGQGEYLVFDEICEPGTTIETIERFHHRYPNHTAGIIITGDASGDNRSTQAAQSNHTNYIQMRNYLSSVGYRSVAVDVPTKNPGVDDRIKAFNAAVCDTLFRRKFKINPDKCKWVKYNMENCKYIEGSSVIWEPTANDIKRDTTNTIKFTKHPLDAVSYIVAKYDPIKLDETLHNKPRLKAVANRPRVY